jgi:hypothetical protein
MQIDIRSAPLRITNAVDVTAATVTLPVPTATKPSGDGVIDMGTDGGMTASGLFLQPYGTGSATNTFSMSVYGWRQVTPRLTQGNGLWVYTTLATFTCTLGTQTGVANSPIDNTHLFVTTIALVIGNANISNEVLSPGDNTPAHITLLAKGCTLIEVRFGTGSSATSCNCLVSRI